MRPRVTSDTHPGLGGLDRVRSIEMGREFGVKPITVAQWGIWNRRRTARAGCRAGGFRLHILSRRRGADRLRVRSPASGSRPRAAVEAVNVRLDAPAIDLTDAVEFQHTDGDRVQVSTAPGTDGIVRRIEVRAREAGSNWAVFALANNGDEQIDRLIVAPHYRMVGSGLIWPDLGLSRIVYITPSSGDPPERQDNPNADVFRITLDPGTVITFVAELRTPNLPQLYLWEPDAYKDKVNSLTLYQGIVIGIAGLLALCSSPSCSWSKAA